MNSKFKSIFSNVSYAISSNLISLVVTTVVILVVPKLIGVEEYGYWQLYLFYSAYVGFFQFGWNDGIYLRYGGEKLEELDKILFFSQFWLLFISQIIISIVFILFLNLFELSEGRYFVLIMVLICLIITGTRAMIIFTLQATNNIKQYSSIIIIDRLFYICLVILILLIGIRDYKILVISDLIGKGISLGLAIYLFRKIAFQKISSFIVCTKEILENMNVGLKLMFANIASLLIIGVIRFGIDYSWSVEVFGKISLVLSTCNFLLLFINAIGVVLFPILKRTSSENLSGIYSKLRDTLMVCSLGLLIFVFPFSLILSKWLPNYSDSVIYLAVLFPIFLYESKTALLVNTYLKTLREEKMMLYINVLTLSLSVLLTFMFTFLYKNLDLAVLSIVIVLAIRSTFAELYLSSKININIKQDLIFEYLLVIIFIASNWYLDTTMSVIIYFISYFIYLLYKKNALIKTFSAIKYVVLKS